MKPFRMHVSPFVPIVVALSVILFGCSAPTASGPSTVRGTVAVEDGILGVALVFQGEGVVPSDAPDLSASIVYRLFPDLDLYMTQIFPIEADGSFVLNLPTASDLPDGVLVPAEEFYPLAASSVEDCALVADDPGARVSSHTLDFPTLPGLVIFDVDGLVAAVVSNSPYDGDPGSLTGRNLITWLYATRDVSIETAGRCAVEGATLDVDIDLKSGWTQVAWFISEDETLIRLRNDSLASVIVSSFE